MNYDNPIAKSTPGRKFTAHRPENMPEMTMPATPSPRGMIAEELNMQGVEIDNLDQILTKIVVSIEPILLPGAPDEAEKQRDCTTGISVVDALRERTRKISSLVRIMSKINDRISL